ncbi:MAG: SMI1/KNR4 family protein [Limisphaerales bacterium]
MIGSLTEFMVPVVYLFTIAALGVGFLWLMDKLFRRTPTKAEIEEQSRHFQERLLAPEFAAVEAHFNATLPEQLKQLYSNKEEILRGDFEVEVAHTTDENGPWFIAFYEPADMDSVREAWPGCEPYFAFANDGCGNDYLIKPGTADPEVVFHDHETGEMVQVAPSLSAFLASPKRISTE